ncbi:MAG TPA: DUF4397 domain-containing protein [Terriglobales bacterium]|nr:DUF4397 domain-containing protein [Terriglobales bacterium]
MKLKIAILGLLSLSLLGVATGAHAQTASVYVVHGIDGRDLGLDQSLPVDVLANGSICLLQNFTFGTVAGPVALDPGSYNLQISLANTTSPCANPAVITADVIFSAGESASVIANLDANGAPTANKYTEDLSPVAKGMSRVLVHHDAWAPAVDIKLRLTNTKKTAMFTNVENPESADAAVKSGCWRVAIFPAGDKTPVLGPLPLKLKENHAYLVYAVGSLTNNTLTLITKRIKVNN